MKTIERVQAVNKKSIKFEHGFIPKDGIKDHEWYKHLGVTPGKWLGTTVLPRTARQTSSLMVAFVLAMSGVFITAAHFE